MEEPLEEMKALSVLVPYKDANACEFIGGLVREHLGKKEYGNWIALVNALEKSSQLEIEEEDDLDEVTE